MTAPNPAHRARRRRRLRRQARRPHCSASTGSRSPPSCAAAWRARRVRRRARRRPCRRLARRRARRWTTSTPSSSRHRRRCTPSRPMACLDAGKHVQVEIPLADSLADAEACLARSRRPASSRWSATPAASTRATSGCTAGSRAGRARHPADGRPDLLLPAEEPQRARASPAPGPTTCCGTTPRTRSTSSPTRPVADRAGQCRPGARCTRSSASRWTCRSSCGPRAARSARCRCRSTTTARSAPSSATSATPAPTSPGTTTSSTGKDEPIDVSHVDVSMDGIELQDREFVAAIREGREPNASIAQVMPCYRTLAALE